MANLLDKIQQQEGRRLEFKEKLPTPLSLVKTIIAFANDAGGEIFIGVIDSTKEITGIDEDELISTEERISNIIFDLCYPIIIPDITFHAIDNKHIIRIKVYRGSNFPYYIKSKGKNKGTYIRVGSTNRLADEQFIQELERQKHNISYDSELVFDKTFEEIDLTNFRQLFQQKTDENFTFSTAQKLNLLKNYQGKNYPTHTCILISDEELRNKLFHYAKIECARFKGTGTKEFIDQKTIDTNIAAQAEEAFEFVLRHINKSTRGNKKCDCTQGLFFTGERYQNSHLR